MSYNMFLLLSLVSQVCCHLSAMSTIAETLAKTNHWNYLAQYRILKVIAIITLFVFPITPFQFYSLPSFMVFVSSLII